MIESGAVRVKEGRGDEILGREHVGGVGFQEEPVGRDLAECLAGGFFAGVEEVSGEGEVGAEGRKVRDQRGGSAVGMEEEAALGTGVVAEAVEEGAPGLETVDGEGAVELGGELELLEEDFGLIGEVVVVHPAIESALTDAGVGEFGEEVGENCEPIRAALVGFPGMEAEGGDDEVGVGAGEGGDLWPIGFAGAVDDAAGDAGLSGSADDI